MGWLKIGLGILAGFIRDLLADLRRENELKQAGYDAAVHQARREATARKEKVDEALATWDSLDDAGRERVRVEQGHYRPPPYRSPVDTSKP